MYPRINFFRTTMAMVIVLATGNLTFATFPTVPLDGRQFDYSEDLFIGPYFGFGTNVTYTEGDFPNSVTATTGLNGFIASPDQIAPIPGFMSGDNVPVGRQSVNDLFPSTFPGPLGDGWADNTISGIGDFQNGFSSFSIHQHKVADVNQSQGPFADAFVQSYANAPFDILSELGDPDVNARLSVNLDSLFQSDGGGFLSEGINVQLLDVTDPDNATVMNDVGGFYFQGSGNVDSSFSANDVDLVDSFTFSSIGTGPGDLNLGTFTYEMDITLDPTKTYALNVISDASAGVSGAGGSRVDSSNTLDVTLQLLDSNARLTLPGAVVVPEPGAARFLMVAVIAFVRRRVR